MEEEVYAVPFNQNGQIYCEIQDGKLSMPKILIKDRSSIFNIWNYLNNWGIDANLSFPRESYLVLKDNIRSHVIVIESDDWKKKNGNPSMHFIKYDEFQKLCDQKVVYGGWGSKECLIGLGAYYLQNANKEVRSWAKAKLISILVTPENNLSTI
jgi:hypothetical protein